jgi:hypothetical protein
VDPGAAVGVITCPVGRIDRSPKFPTGRGGFAAAQLRKGKTRSQCEKHQDIKIFGHNSLLFPKIQKDGKIGGR